MFLIVVTPHTRGGRLKGVTPTSRKEARTEPPDFPMREVLSKPSGQWAGCWGADPLRYWEHPFTAWPYLHLPSPWGKGTPVALPGPSTGPFLVPTLMALVSTAVVQMHGWSHYPGPKCNRSGTVVHWVQALMHETPPGNLPSFLLTLWPICPQPRGTPGSWLQVSFPIPQRDGIGLPWAWDPV